MVDLLKLAVNLRSGEKGKEVLSAVLSGMGTAYPQVHLLYNTLLIYKYIHIRIYHITHSSNSVCVCVCVHTQVADMLLELCVTELEDVATDSQSGRLSSQPVVVESSHPYTDDTSTSGTVKIPGNFQLAYRRCWNKFFLFLSFFFFLIKVIHEVLNFRC